MEVGPGHIELAGVVKTFDGFVNAVDGVNLKIPDGAYCCLLGPSGCGKTTILRMIAGHDDPTAGEIMIGGTVAKAAVATGSNAEVGPNSMQQSMRAASSDVKAEASAGDPTRSWYCSLLRAKLRP